MRRFTHNGSEHVSAHRADGYLATCASDNARARALKETLQRLVDGLSLSQLKPRSYTSAVDNTVGAAGSSANIAFLRGALRAAFKEIKESTLELPSEPYVPEMHTRFRLRTSG